MINVNMNEKIDIIIPVYNKGSFLKECLDSVVKQSYKNIHVILVNDASTDNSVSICQEYAGKYPVFELINLETNSGVSTARSTGLLKSSADWIAFVDADDTLNENYIQSLFSEVKESVDIVAESSNNKNFSISGKDVFYSEYKKNTCTGFSAIVLWGKIFRRNLLLNVYNDCLENKKTAPITWFEDFSILPKIFYNANIIRVIPETNYNYRIDDNSIFHATKLSPYKREQIVSWMNRNNWFKQFNDITLYRRQVVDSNINAQWLYCAERKEHDPKLWSDFEKELQRYIRATWLDILLFKPEHKRRFLVKIDCLVFCFNRKLWKTFLSHRMYNY